MILFSLFMGWAFDRAHMVMCAKNYGAVYNGFGAMYFVNTRQAKAPMAYRVLIPWLVAIFEKLFPRIKQPVTVYQILKMLATSYAFYAVYTWLGLTGALLTFAIALVTVEYDYWDWCFELGGIALAMSGHLWLAGFGIALYAMSRETWPLAAAAYALATADYLGAGLVGLIGFTTWLIVRVYVGRRELYCKRFMIRENIGLLKEMKKWELFVYLPTYISIVLSIVVLGAIATLPAGWPIPLIILLAGWTMAKADEPRVFTAALPWAAMLILEAM